jgi:hypothetical protein
MRLGGHGVHDAFPNASEIMIRTKIQSQPTAPTTTTTSAGKPLAVRSNVKAGKAWDQWAN